MFRIGFFCVLFSFTLLGCAASTPEPAAPEPDARYAQLPADFAIHTEDISVMRTGDERPVPCGGRDVPREYPPVCVTPYGSRDVSEIGQEDAHRSDWEGRPAHIFVNNERTVATLCRFRESACDMTGSEGDSACVDFTQCCTLGNPKSEAIRTTTTTEETRTTVRREGDTVTTCTSSEKCENGECTASLPTCTEEIVSE